MSKIKTSRRNFTKNLIAGYTVAGLCSNPFTRAVAQLPNDYPLVLTVLNSGGWDPLFYCNPSENTDFCHPTNGQIARANGVNYAPIPINSDILTDIRSQSELDGMGLTSNSDFFNRWGHKTVVINGVYTGSVAHPAGRVLAMAGGTVGNPHPVLPALNAGYYTPRAPLAYLSGGGVDITNSESTLVRFNSSASLNDMLRINKLLNQEALHDLIEQQTNIRLRKLANSNNLPAYRRAANEMLDSRELGNELGNFVLPGSSDVQSSTQAKGAADRAKIILHAFQQGYAAGGSISLAGWDSHANADNGQVMRFGELNTVLDSIMREAQALGIANRLYVYVSSEFGRRAPYNGSGKGHWAVGSVMVLSHRFNRSRVIGATDPITHEALTVNPQTAALDSSSRGVQITTGTVHAAMRNLMGIENTALDRKYPIRASKVPIFDGLI